MKKLILLYSFFFLLLISNHLHSQNGWFYKNYFGDYRAIFFLDESTGWVGTLDRLFKTTNGGLTWQPDIISGSVYKIAFANSYTGFVCGSNLFKTTNRGINWTLVNTGVSTYYTDISFANENTGWIVAYSTPKILKTTDGGSTWFICLTSSGTINSIYFVNEMTGWCGRYGSQNEKGLIKSTNGGINWFSQNIDSTLNGYNCLSFVNANTGYCLNAFGGNHLYKTTNSGDLWYIVNDVNDIHNIKFRDNNTGFAACLSSTLKTINGGINFYISDSINSGVFDIFFTNTNIVWTAGSSAVRKSTNAGISWSNPMSHLATTNNGAICKINDNIIWIGSSKSTNQGDTWSNNSQNIGYSYFLTDSIGFTINSGWYYPNYYWTSVLKTNNCGLNWTTVLTTSASGNTYFNSTYFINNFTGWVCRNNGMIYKTTNSGNIWFSQPSGTSNELKKMIFIDQNTGFCTTNNGNLLETTNSGSNWTSIPTGATGFLYGIFFINTYTGWFTGSSGQIFKTTNSGLNWNSQYSGTGKSIYDIYFTDNDYGWACGQNGLILKTLNSGNLWRIDVDNIGGDINNIFFFNHYTGLCNGVTGLILKTTTGGASWIFSENNKILKGFSLSQNYPNPFNPSTIISYKVKSYQVIKLVVYDILGKEVTVLVNEEQQPGEYEVQFPNIQSANVQLPSGIYFYSLYADGNLIETKKMVFIK